MYLENLKICNCKKENTAAIPHVATEWMRLCIFTLKQLWVSAIKWREKSLNSSRGSVEVLHVMYSNGSRCCDWCRGGAMRHKHSGNRSFERGWARRHPRQLWVAGRPAAGVSDRGSGCSRHTRLRSVNKAWSTSSPCPWRSLTSKHQSKTGADIICHQGFPAGEL